MSDWAREAAEIITNRRKLDQKPDADQVERIILSQYRTRLSETPGVEELAHRIVNSYFATGYTLGSNAEQDLAHVCETVLAPLAARAEAAEREQIKEHERANCLAENNEMFRTDLVAALGLLRDLRPLALRKDREVRIHGYGPECARWARIINAIDDALAAQEQAAHLRESRRSLREDKRVPFEGVKGKGAPGAE